MGVCDYRRLCTWWNISVSVVACGLWCVPTCALLASCEAEIMAASEAAKEAVYLREFLHELGFGYNSVFGYNFLLYTYDTVLDSR